ncbi:FkbM family methyltransferase [Chamaesiphon sp. OTE_20_metabat_361]|uniref:FkbM family methyltransferase n=1 Tax=Chamaesiphon sp. OTE_20_metabat_361 TaxID=2964689 RepID=UPI00286AF079|nr:FkbM family methyltransferase [Chamaesiphon sp. OTE_20_metabat_361]
MFIKNTIRRLLPPSVTIRLIADTNYKSGEPELKLLDDLVDPQRNSIDIGANKGSYTYFLSKLSQKVFAYEPNPELAKFLTKAFAKSNVSIYPVAISDRAGVAQLSIPIVDTFAYDQLGSLELPTSIEIQTFDVPLQRLDDCGHHNVGFIKIDVEGHEETVIDGAIDLITTQRPVMIVEIEQKHHANKDITEIFSKIMALGYVGFFLFNGELRSLSEFSKEKHQDINNYQGLTSLGKTYVCNFIFKPS